jgi:hypothetical protein
MAGVNSWPLISTAAAYKVDTPRVQQKMWDMLSPSEEGRGERGERVRGLLAEIFGADSRRQAEAMRAHRLTKAALMQTESALKLLRWP